MDFQMLKRRELQALCKLNNIPANLTNAAMSLALSNLPSVEGLEEFMRDPAATGCESPERSVITSSSAPRTSARQKITQEMIEGSKLGTRTRYGTRSRAMEGTDTRKTPATRTTRRKAAQEATIQKRTEKHLQAEFEADMEQSEVSDNSCLLGEMKEIAEDASGVVVTCENQSSLEIQNESENPEIFDDVHEVFDVTDNKENLENKDAVSEDQDEPTEVSQNGQKLDFHSLGRRDLQSLCKKNKIPANTTSATMADALESLDIVEGLEEFLKDRSSQAPHSPTPSEMTSSCARRTWTSRRITKEPTSSKLVTKSCRGSRRKVDIVQEETAVSETSEASTIVCSMESAQKKEVLTYSRSRSAKIAADQSASLEQTAEMASDDAEVFVDDVVFESDSGDIKIDNVNGIAISEGSKELEISSETGLLNLSENMEFQNVDSCVIEKLEVAQEDQVSEKFNLEFKFEYVDSCLVKKLEGAQEDQVSEKFDSEFTTGADQPPVLGDNGNIGLEICPLAELIRTSSDLAQWCPTEQIENNHREEENTSINYAALISHSNEELEASFTLNEISKDSEANIQTTAGKETPLINKSLRILKRLLKEKLQATSLAKEMENLTLKEADDPLTSDSAANQVQNEDLKDVTEPTDVTLAEDSLGDFDVDAANLYPVNTLLDDLISEDSVTGRINVECDQEVINQKDLSITPSKMMPVVSTPSKTPMSVGGTNHASEVNKENIDLSSNRAESAKISDGKSGLVGSAVSIGKLKKALQQHSGLKRLALQAMSENCLPLASP